MSSPSPAYVKDTIVAQATAPGRGSVGVVRVSGPSAGDIARGIFGRLPEPRQADHGLFAGEAGDVIDEGILLYFPGPRSFTGEDVVEFQGHGSPVALDLLVARCVALGARMAQPGEFSQRAFLNGKIDLAQAEAIADLIDSMSAQAAKGAMRSLQGEFSARVDELVAKVTALRVFVEAAIDFPEDEIDFLGDKRVGEGIDELVQLLTATLKAASQGVIIAEGASVALAGKPNAGKSSLMNALTGRDTSIVTEIPGTTRDVVNEYLHLDGIPLRLVDTAGLRESDETVEAEGIRRAQQAIEMSDLVIVVVDGSLPEQERNEHLASLTGDIGPQIAQKATLALNKVDLVQRPHDLLKAGFSNAVLLSCKRGDGIDQLKSRLKEQLGYDAGADSSFTARARHVEALKAALAAIRAGGQVLREAGAGELLAEELRLAQEHLGQITGAVTADDLLGEIFSTFCIGK